MKPKKHIFVCLHDRPPGDPRGSCKQRGAEGILDALKGELFNKNMLDQVRATGTSCLGNCEHGAVTVTYPEDVWYRGVQAEDVNDIVEEHLTDGEPVERLLLPDEPGL